MPSGLAGVPTAGTGEVEPERQGLLFQAGVWRQRWLLGPQGCCPGDTSQGCGISADKRHAGNFWVSIIILGV